MKRRLIIALSLIAISASNVSANTLGAVQSDIGKVLVSAKTGMTLYTFRNDARNKSNCYKDCATAWPPFTAGASAKADGALGIIDRDDNSRQWTLNGKPLYFWQGDAEVGDATGDGVGGVWDVVKQ